MASKRLFQFIMLVVILAASFASTGYARAWSCTSTITVQRGDTLSGLAATCGVTIDAIRAANPGLGWWVYAGQVLCIPYGVSAPVYVPPSGGGTYVVKSGETLNIISRRIGVSVNDILVLNPQISNASLIYAGQVISLPVVPVYYTVRAGDTMRIIANSYGTSVSGLQALNPQIANVNLIYAGQVIRVR